MHLECHKEPYNTALWTRKRGMWHGNRGLTKAAKPKLLPLAIPDGTADFVMLTSPVVLKLS